MGELCIGRHRLADNEGLYIAGPCAAQTREQLLDTAAALRRQDIMVLRGPDYKPRTSWGQFEGVGAAAYPWYVEAAQKHDMFIAFEVRSSAHLRAVVDYVAGNAPATNFLAWTGARTTEPKLLEEIAEAAALYEQVTLMQKNPLYEGVAEWEGMASRMQALPCHRKLLCHRGYKPGKHTPNPLGYRNVYDHEMAMEVAAKTGLEVILDISHAPGDAQLIEAALEPALAFNYRGLIVEAAPQRYIDQALTDQKQHVTDVIAGRLVARHAQVRRLEVPQSELMRVMMAD